MRRNPLILAGVVMVALVVRIQPAWDAVFGGPVINFLETDAWYHVRLAENQVRNFPWRVTRDPYAAPGGQFVAIAPLFDTVTATAAFALSGRHADTAEVERVAAFVPPVLGALTVVAIYLLARRLFGPLAGLAAAALLAVLPGHFMDRTMLGFVDHHALESLLAVTTLLAIVSGLRTESADGRGPEAAASNSIDTTTGEVVAGGAVGLSLGCYLLSWSGGALLIGILGVWLLLLAVGTDEPARLERVSRLIAIGSFVALALVLAFQDPGMQRYRSQLVGLVALGGLSLSTPRLTRSTAGNRALLLGVLVMLVAAGVGTFRAAAPAVFQELWIDFGRLAPNPARMGVLEARPLFMYPGEWAWAQPWRFFRTGFYVGIVALALFAVRVWRFRDASDLLVWVYGFIMLFATIGQNRFGYYFVTACALLGGWLADVLRAWSRSHPHGAERHGPLRGTLREGISLGTAAIVLAPVLTPPALLMPRTASLSSNWQDAMSWLRTETPPAFSSVGDSYYFGRYARQQSPEPDYTVMNWWDQGYWIVQRARRVPVANPTQARASNAARFYVETDEQRALVLAGAERTRYVLSDWELPYRLSPQGATMGRFQSVLEWAGASHAEYYEVYYRQSDDGWLPLWVFHSPYYYSMAHRLAVLGGAAATPANATTVLTFADRVDTRGRTFREVLTMTTYPTYEAALQAAASSSSAASVIVGLDPWRTAFPVPRLSSFEQIHAIRTPEQSPAEAPWVRIFAVK